VIGWGRPTGDWVG